MKQFINRNEEIKHLVDIISTKFPTFINMYGRRRIGKTSILKHFTKIIDSKFTVIYHVFNYETNEIQLEKFFRNIFKISPQLFPETNKITSWEELLKILFKNSQPLVLILDEFPFIVDINSSLPSILQHLWDEYKNSTKLNIILCGSLVSSMQELMGAKQPLYGRFTHVFHIKPLSFVHSRLFFRNQDISFELKLILYGLFGGIPFYLEAISMNSFKTLKDALIKGPFAEYSVFREEIPLELKTFTRSFTPYFSILIAISMGKSKFSEISNAVSRSSDISRFLDTLIKLDIIERRESFWSKKKRDNRYYIKDNFYRFWFRYFHSYSAELTLISPEQFYSSIVEPSINNFFGLSFEKICGEYIIDLSKKK